MKTIEERAREIQHNFYIPSQDEEELQFIARHLRELAGEIATLAEDHDKAETQAAKESRQNGKGLSELQHASAAIGAAHVAREIRRLYELPEREEKPDE